MKVPWTSVSAPPVQSLSEVLSLDIELEDGSLTVSRGIVTPTVFLQEGVKAILSRVLFTAHKHH